MTTPKKPLVEEANLPAQVGTFKADGSLENPPALLQPNGEYRFGFGSMDGADMTALDYYVKVGQALTAEVQEGTRKPGDIFIADHDSLKEVTLLPLGYLHKQTFWEDGLPICRSYGPVNQAEGDGDDPLGGPCVDCSQRWTPDNRNGKCTPSHTFQAFAVEWGKVVILDWNKTTYRLGKQVYTWYEAKGGFGRFGFKMGVKPVQWKQGKGYAPDLSLLTDEEFQQAVLQVPREAPEPEQDEGPDDGNLPF